MSDSDSNDTIVPDKVLPLPSAVRTLTQMLNAEVEDCRAITRKQMMYNELTLMSVRTPSTTLAKGLMKTKTCTISVEMAQMMVPLFSKHFTMPEEVISELLVQLSA